MQGLDVYEIMVREHQDMLFAYVSSIIDDPALVEDVCQEAFIAAYRHLGELRQECSFAAWLRTIARNGAFAALRKRQREVPFDEEVIAGIEDIYAAVDRQTGESFANKVQVLRHCFDELPHLLRDCCQRHYFDGQQVNAIAKHLGHTLAAVLKRLQRSREALAVCIARKLRLEGHV